MIEELNHHIASYLWEKQKKEHIGEPGWGSIISWNSGYLFQLIYIRFASVRMSKVTGWKESTLKLERIYPFLCFDVETNAVNMPYQEHNLVTNWNNFLKSI